MYPKSILQLKKYQKLMKNTELPLENIYIKHVLRQKALF